MSSKIRNCVYVFMIIAMSGGQCCGMDERDQDVMKIWQTTVESPYCTHRQESIVPQQSYITPEQYSGLCEKVSMLERELEQYKRQNQEQFEQIKEQKKRLVNIESEQVAKNVQLTELITVQNAQKQQMAELVGAQKVLQARVPAVSVYNNNNGGVNVQQSASQTQHNNDICFRDPKKIGLGGALMILASYLYAGPFGALVATGIITSGCFIVPIILGKLMLNAIVAVMGGTIVVLGLAGAALAAGVKAIIVAPVAGPLVLLFLLSKL